MDDKQIYICSLIMIATGYKRWRNKIRKEELELLEHGVSELGWSHLLQTLIRIYSLIPG